MVAWCVNLKSDERWVFTTSQISLSPGGAERTSEVHHWDVLLSIQARHRCYGDLDGSVGSSRAVPLGVEDCAEGLLRQGHRVLGYSRMDPDTPIPSKRSCNPSSPEKLFSVPHMLICGSACRSSVTCVSPDGRGMDCARGRGGGTRPGWYPVCDIRERPKIDRR